MLTDALLTEWEEQLRILDLGCTDPHCSHLHCKTAERMRVLIKVARAARIARKQPCKSTRRRLDQALDQILHVDGPVWVPAGPGLLRHVREKEAAL